MDMPVVVAPGWMRRPDMATETERQSLLFDRDQVGPRDHLAALWLVMPPWERTQLRPATPDAVFHEPIAFNAHLTHWRPPETALTRARFYVLNYLREGEATGWASGFRYEPVAGFAPLFAAVPQGAITDTLMGHPIVAGAPGMAGAHLLPVPLTPTQQAVYAPLWDRFTAGLAASNQALARRPRWVHRGEDHHLDMTTAAACAPFGTGSMQVRFGEPMAVVQAVEHVLLDHPPWSLETRLPVELSGAAASIALPPFPSVPYAGRSG